MNRQTDWKIAGLRKLWSDVKNAHIELHRQWTQRWHQPLGRLFDAVPLQWVATSESSSAQQSVIRVKSANIQRISSALRSAPMYTLACEVSIPLNFSAERWMALSAFWVLGTGSFKTRKFCHHLLCPPNFETVFLQIYSLRINCIMDGQHDEWNDNRNTFIHFQGASKFWPYEPDNWSLIMLGISRRGHLFTQNNFVESIIRKFDQKSELSWIQPDTEQAWEKISRWFPSK